MITLWNQAGFEVRLLALISLISVLALGVSALLRKRNAALAHGIATGAIWSLLVAPLALAVTLSGPLSWTLTVPKSMVQGEAAAPAASDPLHLYPAPSVQRGEVIPAMDHVSEASAAAALSSAMAIPTPVKANSVNWLVILAGLWIAGTALSMLKTLWGAVTIQRLRRACRDASCDKARSAIANVKADLGMRHFPAVLICEQTETPLAYGIRKPIIILPEGLVESLSVAQLQDVLLHEYAHVSLRHGLLALLQRMVLALYWFHPFVHLLDRTCSSAREDVCDNFVLHLSTPSHLARTLVTVAEHFSCLHARPLATGLLMPRESLEKRISALLNKDRKKTFQISRIQMTSISSTALAVVLAAGGVRFAAAQSGDYTVQVRQGSKVQTYHVSGSKPLVVTIKKNGHKTTYTVGSQATLVDSSGNDPGRSSWHITRRSPNVIYLSQTPEPPRAAPPETLMVEPPRAAAPEAPLRFEAGADRIRLLPAPPRAAEAPESMPGEMAPPAKVHIEYTRTAPPAPNAWPAPPASSLTAPPGLEPGEAPAAADKVINHSGDIVLRGKLTPQSKRAGDPKVVIDGKAYSFYKRNPASRDGKPDPFMPQNDVTTVEGDALTFTPQAARRDGKVYVYTHAAGSQPRATPFVYSNAVPTPAMPFTYSVDTKPHQLLFSKTEAKTDHYWVAQPEQKTDRVLRLWASSDRGSSGRTSRQLLQAALAKAKAEHNYALAKKIAQIMNSSGR